MEQIEMRDGHNSFNLKVGESYNVTFDADTKKGIANLEAKLGEARDQAARGMDIVIRLNTENLLLRHIVERLTGEVVEDPAEFLRALQGDER